MPFKKMPHWENMVKERGQTPRLQRPRQALVYSPDLKVPAETSQLQDASVWCEL